jgi:plasmid stabilization system protein ParE
MIEEVVLSPVATEKLEQLLRYLRTEFSERTMRTFLSRLEKSVLAIKKYPESCPASLKRKSIRKCTVTKQTMFFYRVRRNKIEILTIFDSRQQPTKSKY